MELCRGLAEHSVGAEILAPVTLLVGSGWWARDGGRC